MSATLSVHKITVLGAAFLTACGFLYSISSLYQGSRPVVQAPTYHKVERPTIRDTFYRMFEAIKLPPTADSYTDPWGQVFEIKEDGPYWTEPLGREVLIVDIDTRIPNGSNELWDKGRMNWDTLKNEGDGGMISASQMNHFLYAQIHGYDYRFYHANDMDGLHNTWVKPHALLDLIPSYKFVVFLDADATVQHFEVPIEWLLNRWGITPDTSIAMAQDVMQQMGDNDHIGVDDRGNMEHNTGVAIVQNIPYTIKMLTDWRDCPNSNDTHFDGCGRWAEEWAHEQRAFNEYIRYYYNPNGTNIVTIPCDDAMGFPGLGDFGHIASNCTGQFFRHHTIAKDRTKRSTELAMLQAITDLARKELMRNQDAYYLPETDIRRVEDSTTDVEDVNHD